MAVMSINSIASGTTSGSNSSFALLYSIYLGPEIENLEETPYSIVFLIVYFVKWLRL